MYENITMLQAEKRMGRAFRWLLKSEEKRWPVFVQLRAKYQKYRLPLRIRIELCFLKMTKQGIESLDKWTRREFETDFIY